MVPCFSESKHYGAKLQLHNEKELLFKDTAPSHTDRGTVRLCCLKILLA